MRTLCLALTLVATSCGTDAEPTATPTPGQDTAAPPVDASTDVTSEETAAPLAADAADTAEPAHAALESCVAIVTQYCGDVLKCTTAVAFEPIVRFCIDPAEDVCAREMLDVEKAIAAGTLAVSAERVESCKQQLDLALCTWAGGFLPDPFLCPIFDGLVAVGESCHQDMECVDGAYCAGTDKACPGTCTTLPLVGEPCTADYRCSKASYCWQNVCKAASKEGEACTDPNECLVVGFACQGGKCTTPKLGDACTAAPECQAFLGAELTCRGGACAEPGKDGETCTQAFQVHDCAKGYRCDFTTHPDGDPTGGFCVPRAKEGEPCKSAGYCFPGSECMVSAAAGEKVCVAPREIGEPCAQGEPCDPLEGLVCTAKDKICGPPPKEGDSCFVLKTGKTPCAYGLYCAEEGDKQATCKKHVGAGAVCTGGFVSGQGPCGPGLLCKKPTADSPDAICTVQNCPYP